MTAPIRVIIYHHTLAFFDLTAQQLQGKHILDALLDHSF